MSEKTRCPWVDLSKPDYVEYHDNEWGVPVKDDQKLFEFVVLESAQAGLSWYTILKRREGYRRAFANFDLNEVANFDQQKIELLVKDPSIIRHRGKIEAAVNNAQVILTLQQEFGSFSDYVWSFVNGQPIVNRFDSRDDYPTTSEESDNLSADLKKRGFRFFGSTICYAFMQACGLVDDHSPACFRSK